jgi:hypothetical protein
MRELVGVASFQILLLLVSGLNFGWCKLQRKIGWSNVIFAVDH